MFSIVLLKCFKINVLVLWFCWFCNKRQSSNETAPYCSAPIFDGFFCCGFVSNDRNRFIFCLKRSRPCVFCHNKTVLFKDGGDVQEAATLTEDSLKASERSLDSLAATRREAPEEGDGGELSPRLGLAISWDLSSAG